MSVQSIALSSLVTPVETWNPARQIGGEHFDYIDLGAVDSEIKCVTTPQTIKVSDAPSRARQRVKSGDILVSTVRPNLNGVAKVPDLLDGAVASTGFCVLRPRAESLDGAYLFHWVRSEAFIANLVANATGASYPAVTDRFILGTNIPLPPLAEQKRIAAILDQADELRRKRQRAIDRLNQLGQAIFYEMFAQARGMDTFVGDVCDVSSGSTPSRQVPDYYVGNIPWVKTGEVCGLRITSTDEHVSQAAVQASRLKLYPPGTVLLAMYGQGKTRGQVGLLNIHATTNQACAALQCSPSLVPEFLFYHLRTSYERIREMGRGGNQPNLNGELVKQIPLFVPPIESQRRFVEKIRAVEGQQAQFFTAAKSHETLFSSLQHRAFTGAL